MLAASFEEGQGDPTLFFAAAPASRQLGIV
jgi:hypothetical protein